MGAINAVEANRQLRWRTKKFHTAAPYRSRGLATSLIAATPNRAGR